MRALATVSWLDLAQGCQIGYFWAKSQEFGNVA